jgi:hypothetical protein
VADGSTVHFSMPYLDPQTPQEGVLTNKTAGIQDFVEAKVLKTHFRPRGFYPTHVDGRPSSPKLWTTRYSLIKCWVGRLWLFCQIKYSGNLGENLIVSGTDGVRSPPSDAEHGYWNRCLADLKLSCKMPRNFPLPLNSTALSQVECVLFWCFIWSLERDV